MNRYINFGINKDDFHNPTIAILGSISDRMCATAKIALNSFIIASKTMTLPSKSLVACWEQQILENNNEIKYCLFVVSLQEVRIEYTVTSLTSPPLFSRIYNYGLYRHVYAVHGHSFFSYL